VGVVGVRAERNEGARDERRRDEEAVRDDLERAGRPEGPEELQDRAATTSALRAGDTLLVKKKKGRTVSEMASAMPTLRLPSPEPPNRLPNDHHALRIADGW